MKPQGQPSRRSPNRLALASRKLRLVPGGLNSSLLAARPSFQIERFCEIARELPSLFARHYDELAENKQAYPLEPDWERYFGLDLSGILRIMTARMDGILVGYIFNLVGPHLHSKSTIYADIDLFWLDPLYRGFWAVGWFRQNDAYLKEQGVRLVTATIKNGYKKGRVGLIFKRLGYRPFETNFCKVL